MATIWYWSVVRFIGSYVCSYCTIVWLLPFLLLYRFIQPRRSAPREGDNVIAQLHVKCPGPGNAHCIYSRLTTSLQSLAIMLPVYYSTIMASKCWIVSNDIPSYVAIHWYIPFWVNSNRAWQLSIHMLWDGFAWESFQPHRYVLCSLHELWTYHLDQMLINRILRPLWRDWDCSLVHFRVDWLSHVNGFHRIHSPRTLE
jgi:hypothetical protein